MTADIITIKISKCLILKFIVLKLMEFISFLPAMRLIYASHLSVNSVSVLHGILRMDEILRHEALIIMFVILN